MKIFNTTLEPKAIEKIQNNDSIEHLEDNGIDYLNLHKSGTLLWRDRILT